MTATPPTIVRTLQDIRDTIRKNTGNFDPTQLTDSQIDHKINDYYMWEMPEHLRVLKLKTFYIFRTVPNVGQYTVPEAYYQVSNPVYVGGYEVSWNQDPVQFYKIWPEYRFVQTNIKTGDGGASYSFTLSQKPILQGSLTISANSTTQGTNTQVLRDLYSADTIPATNNIVDCTTYGSTTFGLPSGTINYLTGAVSVTFNQNIPTGTSINVEYYPYVSSRPRDVLLFTTNIDVIDPTFSATNYQTYQKQMIQLRAIPNDSYEVKMVAYLRPTQFLEGQQANQTPEWSEWWQLLARGATVNILIEQGDHEEATIYRQYLEQSMIWAQRRLIKQLSSQRVPTIYMENNTGGNVAPFPVFPVY